MSQTAIANPVINSPYVEPVRHFRTTADGGVTGEIDERRRPSEFFVPVARPTKASAQLTLDAFGPPTQQRPNEIVNEIRGSVGRWRQSGYPGVTSVTRDLLAYWRSEDRERRLFFCQIEAVETIIYLTEVAEKRGDTSALNTIRKANLDLNDGLPRLAVKMATGSGKTVVMAMLIAWQTLNKLAASQDRRFTNTFLVVTPGITIRDRLRVLLPNDPGNFYRALDLVTPENIERLLSATIVITNFHAFIRRETIEAASLTKKVLAQGDNDAERFRETPAAMVRRVCRALGNTKHIVVLNDEAHHCYASAPRDEEGLLDPDERVEAKRNEEEARVWLSGLRAVRDKIGIRAIYDLSATPFFLKGSGYAEGTLFPWVTSDFGLMDAIEAGIVKVPRVPVSDDSMSGELPAFRNLWLGVRDDLPKKGIRDTGIDGQPVIPKKLEAALLTLYADYERSHDEWIKANMGRPPVFIVVCSNTSVSKLVFDWIAGWDRTLADGTTVIAPGNLSLFSNERDGRWLGRANTILIDSAQLDRGDALDPAFRKAAAREIEEFKREYVARFPGRSAEEITDEDILREVMNTVGKAGKLGENVRCVVSVAMLTEGWDANTVTHILGIRAFGTQLLCEQVVGRALRRASYDVNSDGMFDPEYAEVYGVPFSFLSVAGRGRVAGAKPVLTVKALPERAHLRIEFPRLLGYRYAMPTEHLDATFDASAILALSTQDVPLTTELDPIVGEIAIHRLPLAEHRMQTVVYTLAKRTLDNHFRDEEDGERPWLFPQLVRIARRWISECVEPYLKDNAYPQMLLLTEYSHAAAERIYQGIVAGTRGEKRLLPVLRGTCAKLMVTDWLNDVKNIVNPDEIVEVRFKNTRKDYYRNVNNLKLIPGEIIAVEASPGHDIGIVSLTGDLVLEQMKKHKVTLIDGDFRKIYRKAKQADIDKWREAISLEHATMIKSRQISAEQKLDMKIGDVEYQGDCTKAIFYYIADERVDFRQLIKVLAETFRIRIEMKQIGARQEAGRIGGIGPCGRELCCATWICSFVSVTTNSARYQDISLNPQKLAGQCGKLKCCLNFEVDAYIDAQKNFPPNNIPLHTEKGTYFFQKADIFNGLYWYALQHESSPTLIPVPVDKVKQIIRLNKDGKRPENLKFEETTPKPKEDKFENVVGQDDLNRFDNQKTKNPRRKKHFIKKPSHFKPKDQ